MRVMSMSLVSVLMFGCAVSAENADETSGATSDELAVSSVPVITLPNGQQVHQVKEGVRCFPYELHFMACSSASTAASCERVGNGFQWTPEFDCRATFQVPCRETASGYGKCAVAPRRGGGGGEGARE